MRSMQKPFVKIIEASSLELPSVHYKTQELPSFEAPSFEVENLKHKRIIIITLGSSFTMVYYIKQKHLFIHLYMYYYLLLIVS
jgi:hypothetical protein